MKIQFNQNHYNLEENSSLALFLETVGLLHSTGIAVAVNQYVIPKTEWNDYLLQDNDDVMVIKATQGG